MSRSSIKYFIIISQVTSLATVMAGEIAQALTDDILDGQELISILRRLIMNLRMVGVGHETLDQIKLVTSKYAYDTLPMKDGDIVIYCPGEVVAKVEVEL